MVREASVHKSVVETITAFAFELGFSVRGIDFSPIKGPEGNIEYLMYLSKESDRLNAADAEEIEEVVSKSHEM